MKEINPADVERLRFLESEMRSCPICQGRDMACSCRKDYRLKSNLILSSIPEKYRKITLETIIDDKLKNHVNAVKAYIIDMDTYFKRGMGLFFYGEPGNAKTALACVVLKEAILHGYSAYFTTVEEYRSTIFDDDDLNEKLHTADYLLIDDVGREFKDTKNFIDSKLDDLVRYRADHMHPTIITANIDSSLLVKSGRLASILKEDFLTFHFKTEDFRQGIQDTNLEAFKARAKELGLAVPNEKTPTVGTAKKKK